MRTLRSIGKAGITLGRYEQAWCRECIFFVSVTEYLRKITMAKLSFQGQLAPLLLGLCGKAGSWQKDTVKGFSLCGNQEAKKKAIRRDGGKGGEG